jgi:hypothetical protein
MWRKLEWWVWGVGLAVFVWMFSVLLGNVGGLWRDEVGSARLAQLATWRWMYGSVGEDSFPPLYNTLLRLWILLGDRSDGWLQNWGWITVLGLAFALWWATRGPARSAPVLALALTFFNPTMYYWGHSVRAYGIAAVLVVLLFGALWRLLERPTRKALGLACVLAILNAQACYQNAPLILAISLAGAGIAAARRLWARAGLMLAPGFVSALSMLIHLDAIRDVQDWNILIRQEVGFGLVWERMGAALGSAGGGFTWVWVALAVGLSVWTALLWRRIGREGIEAIEVRASTFSFATIFLTFVIVFGFVLHVRYPTQEWYYAPFMCLVAAALELGFSPLMTHMLFRIARVALAILLMAASVSPMWERAHLRRTNMDLLAARLRAESTPRDLIVVTPFYCGIGFQYYYQGSTPWMTLPPIAWSEVHNAYENVKPYLLQNEPLGSTIERIGATLRGGGRVFFLGGLRIPPAGTLPPASPPAPHPEYGWSDEMYTQIWSLQVGYFIKQHAAAARVHEIKTDGPVQRFENLPLVEVSGWRP